jgi:aryl-alcohol dehydrogenase-like predicted oxidoreductase
MESRRIGSLEVSVLGLGCNNFGWHIDADGTQAVVDAAIDAGITLFDTADVYGGAPGADHPTGGKPGTSEEMLSAALGRRRDSVVIATKFGMSMFNMSMGPGMKGAHPDYVRSACEASLRRLGTDRIDLYQLHNPDPTVPVDDTIAALEGLRDAGKIVEFGCSNFTPDMLDARWASVQNEISLVHREGLEPLLDACERYGLAILPYFPLASGMLTGKFRRDEALPAGSRLAVVSDKRRGRDMSDRTFDLVESLDEFARSRDHTLLELALSWLAGLRGMGSVIAGATSPTQVKANAAAIGWVLSDEERAEVDRLSAA